MAPQYFENGDGIRPYRHKQMGHLLDLLRDNGIQDQQSLRDWIGGRSVIRHGDAEFQVVTAEDLGLDNENRLYLPEFKIREVIVDCDEVLLQNSSNIVIRDCAFLGGADHWEQDRPPPQPKPGYGGRRRQADRLRQ